MAPDERLREEQSAPDITATPVWHALQRHHDQIEHTHLRELFVENPSRGTKMPVTVGDAFVDYSKHLVTSETLSLLVVLAVAAHLPQRRDNMFAGVHIDTSENRAVLHTALRLPPVCELSVDGQDVTADVHAVLDRM